MFSATFAEAGTGKVPSDILTVSERLGMGAPVDGAGAEEAAFDVAVLVLAAPVPAELAAGLPDEHAATDRPAAQLARASATVWYLFIAFLYSVHSYRCQP
jgi:hypothetical protein